MFFSSNESSHSFFKWSTILSLNIFASFSFFLNASFIIYSLPYSYFIFAFENIDRLSLS